MNTKYDTIDNFYIIKNLGEGFSSKVKLVRDIQSNKLFAIKLIKENSNISSINFIKEIEIHHKLKHNNIISFYSFNPNGKKTKYKTKETTTLPYIVIEYCPNGEIFDYISTSGPLREEIARFYFIQLMLGLEYMHNMGYAHRDLKPENLMLDASFNLKIIDFGFTKSMYSNGEFIKLRTKLGTANYMAPEIHNGDKYDGEKVDVFASGIILFILITGRPPFLLASKKCKYYNLILTNNHKKFWTVHQNFLKNEVILNEEFKDLINKMIEPNPLNRLGLSDISNHSWIAKNISQMSEINSEMSKRKQIIENNNAINLENNNTNNEVKPNFRDDNEHTTNKHNILYDIYKQYDTNNIEFKTKDNNNNNLFNLYTGTDKTYALLLEFCRKHNYNTKTDNGNIIIISKTDLFNNEIFVKIYNYEGKSLIKFKALNGDYLTYKNIIVSLKNELKEMLN